MRSRFKLLNARPWGATVSETVLIVRMIYALTCVYIYIYIYIYMCVCIYIYIYIHVHPARL